ncbi:MAG: 50S ribosomal protein P1 [Candidatus Aenigmatarchaeota archaeon]|nr:50S ribosomal protein P1 [Nanoarchaeota archaeon]
MELIYASLLLHDAGKEITEENVKKVITAAGGKADAAMIKALVSNLKEVNIEEAIKNAAFMSAPAAPASGGAPAEKKEEEKEEKSEEQKSEEAAAGLSSLFG